MLRRVQPEPNFEYEALFIEHVTPDPSARLMKIAPGQQVGLRTELDAVAYGRFIAKVAHSLGITALGMAIR